MLTRDGQILDTIDKPSGVLKTVGPDKDISPKEFTSYLPPKGFLAGWVKTQISYNIQMLNEVNGKTTIFIDAIVYGYARDIDLSGKWYKGVSNGEAEKWLLSAIKKELGIAE